MADVHVIKAERVVRTALGLLERDVTLPRLVWRDAAGDFRGAKGDTITIRLPAYSKSDKRTLRAGTTREKGALTERTVDVTLTDNLYKVIPITDEELTLDIERFNEQIVSPVLAGIARGIEDEVVSEVSDASYPESRVVTLDPDDPYKAAVKARRFLNDARVPMTDRAMIVGSEIEELFLNSDRFIKANESGTTETLREALIGRVSGMPVFTIPALAPDEAYAFHRTAFVLNLRAPFVPRGAPWGASESWEGFAIRVVQAIDPDEVVDNFHADVFTGTNHVADFGTISDDGHFEPSEHPDPEHDDPLFVRAVKIELAES